MEDERIIELFNCRNECAVSAVEEKYGRLLFGVAKRLLRFDRDAEECLNDALLAMWETIPPERPDSLRAYALRFVRNISLDRLKYDLADKRSRDLAVPLSEFESILPDSDTLEQVDFSMLLDDFLSTLTKEARVIFVRRYVFFDTVVDISRDLGITQSKVKSSLMRTRKRFKSYMSEKGSAL